MRTALWIVLGALGVAVWSAVGACGDWGHVMPDAAVMTVAFLAVRRNPLSLAATAVALGYVVGRQALAPVGLHESAMVLCALGLQLVAGHLVGSGAVFFAAVAAGSVVAYHVLLAVLLWLGGAAVGFSSLATSLLLPSAAVTFLLALVSHPVMLRLEQVVTPARREELSWR